MRVLLVVALVVLAGCARPGDAPPSAGPVDPSRAPPVGPPLTFGGVLRDAVSGALVANASVRLDLAQALPCGRQGIGWSSWEPAFANGTFGPLTLPRPRTDEVAFFLHARAGGYSPNATFIGPTQARGDLGNLTVLLHPEAAVEGRAPEGTLVALDAPPFPRVALASNGSFRFEHARVAEAHLVAATEVPQRALVRAPAEVSFERSEARGWTLEGVVRGPSGAPLAADVVAWNGTVLWSVARAGETGVFALPLPAEPQSLRVEARTADQRFGGVLALELAGPPALRETIVASALC